MARGVETRPSQRSSYSYATYGVAGNTAVAPDHWQTYNGKRRPPPAKVGKKRPASRINQTLVLLLCAALLGSMAIAVLVKFASCTDMKKQVGDEQAKLILVLNDNEVLEKDISNMESPEQIRGNATNTLGMVKPSEADIITVRLPDPRPPSDTLVDTPPTRTGLLNFILGFLD